MFEIPTSITIQDKEFPIRNKGDFRMVMDCFEVLNSTELTDQEKIITALIIFYEDINSINDLSKFNDLNEPTEKMYDFFNCGKPDNGKNNVKLIDWDKDAQLIASAVNKVAGKEIRLESYVHWWTFMGYYMAIGESTLSTIVGIRYKIANHKKLEPYEKDFYKDNPEYFRWREDEDNQAMDAYNDLIRMQQET